MRLDITLILEIVTFFILLFLLHKFVFKGLVSTLDKRKDYIAKNLADVDRLKKETELRQQKAEELLLEAKRTALSIKEEAFAYGERLKEEKAGQAEAEAAKIRQKAAQELAGYINKVKEELKGYAAELSFEIAAKILAAEVDKNKHKDLVEASLKQFDEQGRDRF